MSGHSHWAGIKHKKELADIKKGKIFSKLARLISIAAKEKGGDPETNPKLRMAIEKAKEFNMPNENIERAIKKGIGALEDTALEEVLCEAYGPGGIALIIEGITDSKNRTLAEIKHILESNNGKLASPGSVQWMFERKGCIVIKLKAQNSKLKTKEELELIAIEAGAEDIYWHNDDILDIYTKIEDLDKVKNKLLEQGLIIESASLDWVAKNQITLEEKTKKDLEKLFEALDENDDVQEIYSNSA